MPEKKSKLPKGLQWKRGLIIAAVRRNGKLHTKPTGTTVIKDAQAVLDSLLSDITEGRRQNAGVGNVTCGKLLENYLDRLRRTSKTDSGTHKNTKGVVEKHVLPFFGTKLADKITRKHLETYRDQKLESYSQVTINRHLGYLRSAFRRGKLDRLTNNEPDFTTSILRGAEENNVRTGIITESQYQRLVQSFGDDIHVQTLFVLGWNSGVRPAEAFRLEWSQVDWENRVIAIYKRQEKTGNPRYLPLKSNVMAQLETWQQYLMSHIRKPQYIFTHPVTGRRMTKNDYRVPWQNACLKAGLAKKVKVDGRYKVETDVLMYDSRRAFRTYLPAEINANDGKSVMGHTQDSTYARYLNQMEAAKRVLNAMEPNKTQESIPTQTAPTPTQTALSITEKIAAIKDLGQMLKDGLLTPEEFAAMKAAL